jgi:hypothetical protein
MRDSTLLSHHYYFHQSSIEYELFSYIFLCVQVFTITIVDRRQNGADLCNAINVVILAPRFLQT